MNNLSLKIRIFTIADYEEEEKWLERQHQKGWKLKRAIAPCFFFFESCEPEEYVYQLDYKNCQKSEDYLTLFRDYGWEYCGSCAGWNYFRKAGRQIREESEREIFSDNESKITMIDHIYKTRMLPILLVFLAIILPNLFFSFPEKILRGIYAALFLIYVPILGYCGFKLHHLKKNLKN